MEKFFPETEAMARPALNHSAPTNPRTTRTTINLFMKTFSFNYNYISQLKPASNRSARPGISYDTTIG